MSIIPNNAGIESAPSVVMHRRVNRRICLFLAFLTILLYGRDLTHSRGTAGDSFHHLINGVFIHDVCCDIVAVIQNPRDYVNNYYSYFPAVNVGYYPPVFYVIEAAFMFVFGVSAVSGQLAVLAMVIIFVVLSYYWMRLRMPAYWAAASTGVLISCPMLVLHGRDIMLELPVMAFMMGAILCYEHLLRADRPRLRLSLGWAILTALAIWTKQHAILLLPIFVFTTLFHFHRRLLNRRIIVGAVIIGLAFMVLALITLRLGGDAVGHSVGFTAQHVADRFNWDQWTYYIYCLPDIVGWPMLMLALIGILQLIRAGQLKSHAIYIVWILSFYFMHSYFKAQEARYGCLWVPPFCALAVIGIMKLTKVRRFTALLMMILLVWSIGQGYVARLPRVPDAFQLAAADLRDKLGPFTCLSFVPDKPGRLPVCFRLALEDRPDRQRSIFSFGRILRAGQVWSARHMHWRDQAAANEELRDWNVKYVALTEPAPLEANTPDYDVAGMMRGLLDSGEFVEIRRYPVDYETGIMKHRELVLYERKEPMTFNQNAQPQALTGRLRLPVAPATRPSP